MPGARLVDLAVRAKKVVNGLPVLTANGITDLSIAADIVAEGNQRCGRGSSRQGRPLDGAWPPRGVRVRDLLPRRPSRVDQPLRHPTFSVRPAEQISALTRWHAVARGGRRWLSS